MRNIKLIIAAIILCVACKKVEIKDALSDMKVSQTEITADGQSTITVSVTLSEKSSTDRRNVIFSTSAGVFTSSGSSKYTAAAEYIEGVLIAKATLKAPMKPGTIKIEVKPEFDSSIKEFTLSESVTANASVPTSILLDPSALGIASNFMSEVTLKGTLKNSKGKFVSEGYKVVFEDFLQSGGPANGQFRKLKNTTSDSSYVSAIYGASQYPIGTVLKLKTTVLDESGNKTAIADSVLLTINL